MTAYEAEAYVRGVQRKQRAGWEQARYIAYCTLRPWSKDLDLNGMLTFPWEEENKMSAEEQEDALAALRERTKEFEEYLNNKSQWANH